jgi:hypothetical protein
MTRQLIQAEHPYVVIRRKDEPQRQLVLVATRGGLPATVDVAAHGAMQALLLSPILPHC